MTVAPAATGGQASHDGGGEAGPRHVAIIMDGNGRWAQRKGLPRVAGHRAGAEAVRRTLNAAVKAGVEVLTLYAFSSENWRRSEEEVSDLKGLMRFYLDRELATLEKEGVQLRLIGDHRAFGPELVKRIDLAVERTRNNQRLTLVIALNYGSRGEIASVCRDIARRVKDGELELDAVNEALIDGSLQTREWPELDLLIRTSGEQRLSNFLLWQAAYAELLFVDTLWPDFDEVCFEDAMARYAARHRRFGGR